MLVFFVFYHVISIGNLGPSPGVLPGCARNMLAWLDPNSMLGELFSTI